MPRNPRPSCLAEVDGSHDRGRGVAGGGRRGRIRLRHGRARAHTALPRPASRADGGRAVRAGERPRGLGGDCSRPFSDQRTSLPAGRDLPPRPRPPCRVRRRALAALAVRRAGRHAGDAGAPGPPRHGGDGAALDRRPPGPAHRPSPAVRPRLPRAAPRQPGLRHDHPARGRRAGVAPLPGRSRHHRPRQFRLGGRTRAGSAASPTPPSARAGSTTARTWPAPAVPLLPQRRSSRAGAARRRSRQRRARGAARRRDAPAAPARARTWRRTPTSPRRPAGRL